MSKIIVKNKMAIERMRIAGELLARVMEEIAEHVVIGCSTYEIDRLFEQKMLERGLKPECKGYAGYKYATCISLNDVVVHGIPSKEVILKSGDFVTIDVVGSYKKYCVDMARCFFVGKVDPVAKKMAAVAQQALDVAIDRIKPGCRLFDISVAIQQTVENEGFSVVRSFAGHGIGRNMHEEPEIPNFRTQSKIDVILQEGMTLAIEPMIAQGSYDVQVMADGWTAKTVDGGFAAHVEDTVLVTKDGAEIFTRI
ncbi:MAG: type I methionyl aminopeptidase [bacterium]